MRELAWICGKHGMAGYVGHCSKCETEYLNDTIARLKEDANRLIDYAVMYAHGNEDYRCTMCGNLVDRGEEHKQDCPITLHRALMKELE